MRKAMLYGLLASMFFALTFILNRSMNLGGGYWLWSASLRYLFMVPILWVVVIWQKRDTAVFRTVLRSHVSGILLRRILVCGGNLADHHCGRCSSNALVRRKNPGKKSAVFLRDSAWYLPTPDFPSGWHADGWLPDRTDPDSLRGHLLSLG